MSTLKAWGNALFLHHWFSQSRVDVPVHLLQGPLSKCYKSFIDLMVSLTVYRLFAPFNELVMTCLCWVSVLAFHTQNFSLLLDKGYLGFGPKNQKIGFNIVDVQSNEIATQRLTYQKKNILSVCKRYFLCFRI